MLEPGNLDRILKGTTGGSATDVEVYNGVPCLKSPLPVVWNNLYTAWNLAFCANYSDWPLMFAKLLNPATLGLYQACKENKFGNFMVVVQLILTHICLFKKPEKCHTCYICHSVTQELQPGLYASPRIVALYVHVFYMVCQGGDSVIHGVTPW